MCVFAAHKDVLMKRGQTRQLFGLAFFFLFVSLEKSINSVLLEAKGVVNLVE